MTSTIKHVGNPVTAEIIRNALIAITDEMKTNLMRTAYNPIIYEALDFTVGLFDRNGDNVGPDVQPISIPQLVRGVEPIFGTIDECAVGAIQIGERCRLAIER